jgi:hypothetical protein
MRMRIHEWLADHVSWVQYPSPRRSNFEPLWVVLRNEYRRMSRRQRAWVWFLIFWSAFFTIFS